ncbi:hypothetical protein RZS08_36270, partial [Arthrospira platensis SPKY1]|nr:hypothetical protein [Arthrospira platensis SPKY1]
PGGGLGQGQPGLDGVFLGVAHQAARPFVDGLVVQALSDDGAGARARVGRADDALPQQGQSIAQGRVFTAPPGGQRRQRQCLAEQVLGNGRQKTEQGAGLQRGRTGGVGQEDVAGPDDLQQTGHAQGGVGTQLQRV